MVVVRLMEEKWKLSFEDLVKVRVNDLMIDDACQGSERHKYFPPTRFTKLFTWKPNYIHKISMDIISHELKINSAIRTIIKKRRPLVAKR